MIEEAKKYAPIVLFCYNRPDTLAQTIQALQKNHLANESELIIFSDGAKGREDIKKVENVRTYLTAIEGFRRVIIYESQHNKGLANSIISGVTQVLEDYNRVIVLEDDLVSSLNFLTFMNEALEFYRNEPKVFSIAGFSVPIKGFNEYDVYFTHRSNSTGWATWRDRWEPIDWKVSDYNTFKKDKSKRKLFNRMGSDMTSMLDRQMTGEINSWAIRWCYHQFKKDLFSVHALVSKIDNIGFTPDASNTKETYNRFKTVLDQSNQVNFNFSPNIKLDSKIVGQFTKPFSIGSRIKYKILNRFNNLFNAKQ